MSGVLWRIVSSQCTAADGLSLFLPNPGVPAPSALPLLPACSPPSSACSRHWPLLSPMEPLNFQVLPLTPLTLTSLESVPIESGSASHPPPKPTSGQPSQASQVLLVKSNQVNLSSSAFRLSTPRSTTSSLDDAPFDHSFFPTLGPRPVSSRRLS